MLFHLRFEYRSSVPARIIGPRIKYLPYVRVPCAVDQIAAVSVSSYTLKNALGTVLRVIHDSIEVTGVGDDLSFEPFSIPGIREILKWAK